MKRVILSLRKYLIFAIILSLIALAVFLIFNRPEHKTPDRALFVLSNNIKYACSVSSFVSGGA